MSQWAGGVLTAAGRALQAKVEAGTTALVLTKIKLGDGTESMDAVDNLTDLVGAKAVLGISSAVSEGDHATITGVVLSTQLQAGFWCREWGLFAMDPDAGEILYMITIDAQPEWLPANTAAAQVSATYAMNIAVANATNIEVQIDPAGLVDVEMLQSYMGLAKRSTAVALGNTAMLEGIPAGYFLECSTAGTTGATAPVVTPPVSAGQTITDGSVVWKVRKTNSIFNTLQMGVFNHKETFTSSGSFTAPVTGTYRITLQGGGGGGGGAWWYPTSTGATNGGGGGGGQGATLTFYAKLTAGQSYAYTIGAGGSGGKAGASGTPSGNNGTNGGRTSITIGTNTYQAAGGTPGSGYFNYGTAGFGGEGKINNTLISLGLAGTAGNSGGFYNIGGTGGGGFPGGTRSNSVLGGGGAGGITGQSGYNDGLAGGDGYITFEYCKL